MEFALRVQSCKEVFDFIKLTNERIKNKFFLKNSTLRFFKKKDELILLFVYDANMGKFPLYVGFVLALGIFLIKGLTSLLIFPALISGLYYFTSEDFVYRLLCKGLKKGGYTGKIKRLSRAGIVRELIL